MDSFQSHSFIIILLTHWYRIRTPYLHSNSHRHLLFSKILNGDGRIRWSISTLTCTSFYTRRPSPAVKLDRNGVILGNSVHLVINSKVQIALLMTANVTYCLNFIQTHIWLSPANSCNTCNVPKDAIWGLFNPLRDGR